MTKTKFIIAVGALAFLTSCANDDSTGEQQRQQSQVQTTFASIDTSKTRTSIDHTIGGGADAFWEAGDNIWAKVGTSYVSSTSSNITAKTARAKFYFTSGSLTAATYPVTYTGKASTKGDEVTIATTQTQSAPNNTEHLGVSGDCGIATAHRDGAGVYNFKLEHKAAYLCFQPRSTNPYVNRSKLIKIEVTSDKPLAGTYGFSASGLSATPISGASKTIVLNTNQFALDNTTADLDKNGSYMVLAPGLHHLTVCYWLRNTTDHEMYHVKKPIEGFIPQQITINVEAGKIYDITADLKIPSYEDPTLVGGGPTVSNTANNPNVNEVVWLASAGDPHWNDKMLWVSESQHLYQGGMWFKKLSVIATEQSKSESYLKTIAPDGNDYRTTEVPSSWMKTAAEGIPQKLSDCFFLPAAGICIASGIQDMQGVGYYWTSSKHPSWPSPQTWYLMKFWFTKEITMETTDGFYGYNYRWTPL